MTVPYSEKFYEYLDEALKHLCLECQQQNEMVKFWMPKFRELTNIAFRFLTQHEINTKAPITVTPKPGIVHHVLLVFGEGYAYDITVGRKTNWERVVEDGADMTGWEAGKFSMLEWGAMLIEWAD